MVKRYWTALTVFLLGLLLVSVACSLRTEPQLTTTRPPLVLLMSPAPSPPVTPTQPPHNNPTPTASPAAQATITPAATEFPDLGWQPLRQGLERQWVNLLTSEGGVRENLYVVRIDPAMYDFDVGYKPGAPQRLMDWQSETDALVVVNGGFFTAEGEATGLIIVDGLATGTSYAGFGGMLAVNGAGPILRSLRQQPYDPNEPLHAALQSFPLLVAPDGQIGYPQEDGLADRRTVIGQDRQGRILLILATSGTMTLHEMSRYLVESDLDLSIALNLDGGASTGILLAEPPEGVAPFSLLPIVITVHPKERS
ncbi:MAG: phosphodiester glycosidase family protein [Chloroflexota bacterium]|nr:MAG: phosphodiester glycosidase family protein [Chloroflexota bacterium]